MTPARPAGEGRGLGGDPPEREPDVEQRVATRRVLDGAGLERGRDDVLERQHGMAGRRERRLADPGEQLLEAGPAAEVHADHGGLLEHADQICQFLPVSSADRHTDGQVRSVGAPGQGGGEPGEQAGEPGRVVLRRESCSARTTSGVMANGTAPPSQSRLAGLGRSAAVPPAPARPASPARSPGAVGRPGWP